MHHVHWKTSAKLGELMVRELGEAEQERLTVGFVPRISETRDPAEFEILVSAAASLVSQLVRSGAWFLFIADELELSPGNMREQERSILTYLAKVGACDELAPEFLSRLGQPLGAATQSSSCPSKKRRPDEPTSGSSSPRRFSRMRNPRAFIRVLWCTITTMAVVLTGDIPWWVAVAVLTLIPVFGLAEPSARWLPRVRRVSAMLAVAYLLFFPLDWSFFRSA